MDEEMNEYPQLQDLTKDEIEELVNITEDKLSIDDYPDFFTDDHLPCVSTTINHIKCSFWWLDREQAGAFYYWKDSLSARVTILGMIQEGFEDWVTENEEPEVE